MKKGSLLSLADNSQKTPLAQGLQKLARAKAADATWALGFNLPCTVAAVMGPGIVKVNFEVAGTPFTLPQVEMPVAKPPYVQYPITVGDIGVARSASVRTAALTGLGPRTPNLQDVVGNFSAMEFHWLGSASEAFIDPEAVALYGNIFCTPTQLAFFGGGKTTKQAVTGALSAVTDANAKAVLLSLITALTNYGLITNETT